VFGHTDGHDHAARDVRWLAAAALAALLRSLAFEKVTVAFEQPPTA